MSFPNVSVGNPSFYFNNADSRQNPAGMTWNFYPMKFIDPSGLPKTFRLNVQCVVDGLLAGLHTSPHHGHSLEFAQHRQYSSGDELRHIDWKVFARTDRFFVKQFQDETNLRAYILLDSSGSMNFCSQGQEPKLSYASSLAAALSCLLLRQNDAVSLGIFDTSVRYFLPPRNQLTHLSLIFDELEKLTSGGETSIAEVLHGFSTHLKRRGLLILISDLLSGPEEVLRSLKYFRARHHEIMVLHTIDPAEISFPFTGDKVFVSMENKEEIFTDAETLKDTYRDYFAKFIEKYKIGFRQSGIHYHLMSTDLPIELALAKLLAK